MEDPSSESRNEGGDGEALDLEELPFSREHQRRNVAVWEANQLLLNCQGIHTDFGKAKSHTEGIT